MATNSATDLDNGNPYRNQTPLDRAPAEPTYHPKAHGLTGQTLDSLLMAAMTEGANIGKAEGINEALSVVNQRAAGIWDEGHREGVLDGQRSARSALYEATADEHTAALEALREIAKITESERIRQAVEDTLAALTGIRSRLLP